MNTETSCMRVHAFDCGYDKSNCTTKCPGYSGNGVIKSESIKTPGNTEPVWAMGQTVIGDERDARAIEKMTDAEIVAERR